jgi:hypothetical protein
VTMVFLSFIRDQFRETMVCVREALLYLERFARDRVTSHHAFSHTPAFSDFQEEIEYLRSLTRDFERRLADTLLLRDEVFDVESRYDCLDRNAVRSRKVRLLEHFSLKYRDNRNSDRFPSRYRNRYSGTAYFYFAICRALLIHAIVDNFYGLIRGNEDACSAALTKCIDALSISENRLQSDSALIVKGQLRLSEFRRRFIDGLLLSLGASVVQTEGVGNLSYLISVDDDHRIYCPSGIDDFAKSFAILHEIAHLQLRHTSRFEFADDDVFSEHYRYQEYSCDQFAILVLKCVEDLYILAGGETKQADFDLGIIRILRGTSGIVRTFNAHNSNYSVSEIVRRLSVRTKEDQVPQKGQAVEAAAGV